MQTNTLPTHDQPSSSSSSSNPASTDDGHPFAANPTQTGGPQPATWNPNPETAPKERGRPTLYHPRILEILTQIIAQSGRSDSSAAELAGISTSTLSRWKQADPELAIELLRAREKFRERQLHIMNEASHQRGGWRAAAWLLERIFPEDYSSRASEREKFRLLAREREAEKQTSLDHPASHPHPHPHPQAPSTPTTEPAPSFIISPVTVSQNSQNPPPPSLVTTGNLNRQVSTPAPAPLPTSGGALQNSQNAATPSIVSSRTSLRDEAPGSPVPKIPEIHFEVARPPRAQLQPSLFGSLDPVECLAA